MSVCTNRASVCIFASVVGADEVSAVTFCLISGEASRRPRSSPSSQRAMSFQLSKPLVPVPLGGNKETTILPATPLKGGMLFSSLTAGILVNDHCHWFDPDDAGAASAWLSHTSLCSHPAGNCSE